MLKVNNKKVIQDLAKTTYKANKKRNLLTIVAIFLTTFLLCTVISIGLSYWDTVSLRQQRMQGIDYDIELTEPRDDQVSTIRKMDNVKYGMYSNKDYKDAGFGDFAANMVRPEYWVSPSMLFRGTYKAG